MKAGSIQRHRKKLLAIVLLAVTAGWASTWPSVQWRQHLISLKFQGLLPEVRWSDLLFGSNPQERLPRERTLPTVLVREKERGEEPCAVLWETSIGDFWGRESDEDTLRAVVAEQSLNIYERGPVTIRRGDVVFDVGSHLGAFTRFALQRGAGLVVAFEPEATNIACYKRTFQQEIGEGRIILVEAALWEAPGTLDFTTGEHSGAGSVHPVKGSSAHLVPATTIDETVARLKLDRLDFIKMDIEGSERYALRGGRQSISRFQPRMAICTYHRQDDREAVPSEVLDAQRSYKVIASRTIAYFHTE